MKLIVSSEDRTTTSLHIQQSTIRSAVEWKEFMKQLNDLAIVLWPELRGPTNLLATQIHLDELQLQGINPWKQINVEE